MMPLKREEQDRTLRISAVDELQAEYDRGKGIPTVFSTTLSAHEVYLLKQSGLEPVKVVVGNIVYSIGVKGIWNTLKSALVRGEMKEFTHLNQIARDLAIQRLMAQASEAGATGVVAVHLDTLQYGDFIEITAIGTAVRPSQPIASPIHTPMEIVLGA